MIMVETAHYIMDAYNLRSVTIGGKLEGYGQWEGRFSTIKIAKTHGQYLDCR